MHIFKCQTDPILPPIKHRSLEKTTEPPPLIDHRYLENHQTKKVSYIAECTYTYVRLNPPLPPIEHRPLENCYTR